MGVVVRRMYILVYRFPHTGILGHIKKITCLSSPPVQIFSSRPHNYILYAHAQTRGQRAHASKPAAIKKDSHTICRSPNTKWCKAPQVHSHFHATSKELSFMYICCCVKV